MTEKIVKFSRLLKIFEVNNKPAYIIELKEKEIYSFYKNPIKYLKNVFPRKKLYISFFLKTDRYNDKNRLILSTHQFTPYKENILSQKLHCNNLNWQSLFSHLSKKCLMSECTDGRSMFRDSPITHFEANCSCLANGDDMFLSSNLKHIDAKFPILKNANSMFQKTKLKKINIDFPNLKNGNYMFYDTPLKKISACFLSLNEMDYMFTMSKLKTINCQFLNIKDKMFFNTPIELKTKYPYYFA